MYFITFFIYTFLVYGYIVTVIITTVNSFFRNIIVSTTSFDVKDE